MSRSDPRAPLNRWVSAWNALRGRSAESGDASDFSARLIRVQEEERKRLSRELHDGVGQIITALKMELSKLQAIDNEADRGRLHRARAHADEALQTIRNVSRLLRPTLLDDLGLEAALQWHVEDFTRRTGIRCRLSFRLRDDSLNETVATGIYRTIQEALNNCEKHSGATEVSVTVEEEGYEIVVSIQDNGQGFSPESTGKDHFGILGMRERSHMLGGDLQIESKKGSGTTVTLRLGR